MNGESLDALEDGIYHGEISKSSRFSLNSEGFFNRKYRNMGAWASWKYGKSWGIRFEFEKAFI
jgi:hypothetical protein